MDQLTISIAPDIAERLRLEAEGRGISAEKVAAEALEAWVAGDDTDAEDDLRRLAEVGDDCDPATAFSELRSEIERLRHERK